MTQSLGGRVLIALPILAVVAGLLTYSPAIARTYFEDLPPDVVEVSVDEGVSSDGGGSGPVVVQSAQPTFRGLVEPGITSIELIIRSVERRYTVPVDPVTGFWEFSVPEPLEPGTHSLLINDALVGQFTVEQASAQIPPAETGHGALLFDREAGHTTVVEQTGLLAAAAGLTVVAALAVRRLRRGR